MSWDRIHVDLHTHTSFSCDSMLPPAVLVEQAAAAGLERIAITDHNEIEGAFEAHTLDPHRVIVGEEVHCWGGVHLIGLFLRDRIPAGLPVEEVAERIRDQGGVVYAPHPCAYPFRKAERSRAVLNVADVVEAANSRAFWPRWNRLATKAAAARRLPVGGGSDAHFAREIGRCRTEMPSFTDAAGFRTAIRESRVLVRTIATPLLPAASFAIQLGRWAGLRSLRSVPHPARGRLVPGGR